MKSTASATRAVITGMHIQWLLLLTGGRAGVALPARRAGAQDRGAARRIRLDSQPPPHLPRPCLPGVLPAQAPPCRTTCASCTASSTCSTARSLGVSGAGWRWLAARGLRWQRPYSSRRSGLHSARLLPTASPHPLSLPPKCPHLPPGEDEFLEQFGDERTGMTPDQVRALQVRVGSFGASARRRACCAVTAGPPALPCAAAPPPCRPSHTWAPPRRPLQEELRPILLRRMKEDVETLPEKEEVRWGRMDGLQCRAAGALCAAMLGHWGQAVPPSPALPCVMHLPGLSAHLSSLSPLQHLTFAASHLALPSLPPTPRPPSLPARSSFGWS